MGNFVSATRIEDEVYAALQEQCAKETRSQSFVIKRALIRDLRRRGHDIADPTAPSPSPIDTSGPEAETPDLTKTDAGGLDEGYRT